MKVHIIDGTFEVFRCFFGAPRATGADGAQVGGARGVLFTMMALLRQPDVSHLAVAFDAAEIVRVPQPPSGPNPERGGTREELLAQLPLAIDLCRALGITVWPMSVRYQADDALGTAAIRYKGEPGVEQVVLCTTDKDLAQVVDGERVILHDRIRKTFTDEAGVMAKWGVAPASIPDYLGLVGDPQDGIPGLPGWGKTSAGALLREYGHVESIPSDPADWGVRVRGATALARTLAERRNEAILYRNLARLKLDVPLPDKLADLEWTGPRDADLLALATALGFDDPTATLKDGGMLR